MDHSWASRASCSLDGVLGLSRWNWSLGVVKTEWKGGRKDIPNLGVYEMNERV